VEQLMVVKNQQHLCLKKYAGKEVAICQQTATNF